MIYPNPINNFFEEILEIIWKNWEHSFDPIIDCVYLLKFFMLFLIHV